MYLYVYLRRIKLFHMESSGGWLSKDPSMRDVSDEVRQVVELLPKSRS